MRKVVLAVFLGCIGVAAVAVADLEERVSKLEAAADLEAQTSRLSLGGYGEFHATRKGGDSYGDYHRVVMYAGYQFNEWIRLNSEIELEHSKAGAGDQGYVLLEQFNVDLQVADTTAIRLGRSLAPLGIVGPRHEPPLFFGVERPNLEKYILPSTWSIDGVGLVGDLSENISYEIYAVGGLDSSSFNETEGIRGGREAEYPGLEKPSITGRIDSYALENLRFGGAFYQGSTGFTTKGDDNKDPDNEIQILSVDFEYEYGPFSLNGVWVTGKHDGTNKLMENTDKSPSYDGVALPETDFGGHYVTVGYEVWRSGEKAIIPFIRLSEYDTHEASASNKSESEETTIGLHIPLSDQFVIKVDQVKEDISGNEIFSVGFGMMFQ